MVVFWCQQNETLTFSCVDLNHRQQNDLQPCKSKALLNAVLSLFRLNKPVGQQVEIDTLRMSVYMCVWFGV